MKLSKALGKVLLLAFMVGMVSCQKDTLSVSPMGDIVFGSETESQRIKIKCNGDWYIIVDGAWGAWLELDKKDGSGDAIVTVSVKPNPNIESRKCVLRVYDYDDTEIALNVTQKGLYKGTLLVGAWRGEKEESQLYGDDELIDKSSADLSASVLEFNADGTYMLWEQDGYFWKELYNDTYYVEDDMLVLTDSEGGKDYEITSMTSSKVTMRYCEEYYDANLGKQCVKTIVRTYKKDEAWVTPALFQLKDYHVSLNVQGQYQIISNGTDVTYRSLTPYVADVDGSGLITANFVGTAIVEVMANEGSHTFEVNVKSKYPKYEEPCLDFTKTEAQIHKLYGDNYMGKDKNGGQYFRFANYYHVYYFKGTMYHAVLLLPSVDADTAIDFLLERYHYALYDEELNSLVFTNKTDLWAVLGTYSSTSFGTGFSIEYIPRDNGGEANDGNANNHRRFLSPEKRFMEQMEDFLDLHKWTE